MTGLARFSLANRALIALITAFCAVFGVIAAGQLKQELIPPLELPMISVTTAYPGASSEVVDKAVGEPLERALQGVEGLSSSRSTSSAGVNSILLRFEYGTDLNRARSQVDRAVANVGQRLPDTAETTSFAGSVSDFPVMFLAVSSDGDDLNDLRRRVEDAAVPHLQRLDGVRAAEVTGGTQTYVSVVPDEEKLAEAGLTVQDVRTALEENGGLRPAGQVEAGELSLPVQSGTPVESLEQLRQVMVAPSGGGGPGAGAAASDADGSGAAGAGEQESDEPPRARPLEDVARVETAEAEPTSLTRTDGVETLALSITAAPDADVVAVSEAVQAEFDALRSLLGEEAEITVVFDQAPFIQQSIDTLLVEGLLGLGFAVLVIALFLFSLRSTLVTAVSIPLSLLVTLIGVWTAGFSLNLLTLGALTIAIGRVVDDSIVVVENIRRHLGLGAGRREAILTGTGEVALAITASTLTSVAVFAPIAFVSGQAGELFRPFALTMTIALLASLLVALTIVPVLCWWFLRAPRTAAADAASGEGAGPAADSGGGGLPAVADTWLTRAYRPVLRATQARPALTLAGAVAVLAGTVALVPLMPTNLLGDTGQNSFTVTSRMEPGSSLEATARRAERIESALRDAEGVETVQLTIGSSGMRGGFGGGATTDEARFTVLTDPEQDQPALQQRVRERLTDLQDVGEVSVSARQGMGGSSDVEVTVSATRPEALDEAAARVARAVRGLEGVREVGTPATDTRPTFQVDVDAEAAAKAGLSDEAVTQQVAAALGPVPGGSVRFGFEEYDVRIGDPEKVDSLEALRQVRVRTAQGPVTLDELADVRREQVPAEVTSSNGERTAVVTVTPEEGALGSVSREVSAAVDGVELPSGASAEVGGAAAEQQETFSSLLLALLAAVAAVYVVMVATFRSLRQPLVLLVSIPFAATGALLMLLLTGTPLGMPAMIGLLMLVGIVVTNAIVLIDLINRYRGRDDAAGAGPSPGADPRVGPGEGVSLGLDAAIERGALNRVRPVVMTALATILALVPMSLGLTGHSGFISQPLAVAVVGGLVSSTVLTLVVVPVLYRLTEVRDERRRVRRREEAAEPAAARAGRA